MGSIFSESETQSEAPSHLAHVIEEIRSHVAALDIVIGELRKLDLKTWDEFYDVFSHRDTRALFASILAQDLPRYSTATRFGRTFKLLLYQDSYVLGSLTSIYVRYRVDHGECWVQCTGEEGEMLRFKFDAKGQVM